MSYTTFTVTVSNPGSGNKFYIDGALQAAVPLAYGATYRFDQSDASNAGYTLKISTTSDGTHGGGSDYTTGVTLVGTPGQAGAYTQFVVTEVGPPLTMYYYEVDDSGMGGTLNLTANSWGGLYWGHTGWGEQAQVNISQAGLSLTSSIGNETPFGQANVSVSGIQATLTNAGAVGGTSVDQTLTGIAATLSQGNTTAGLGKIINLGSVSATFSIGSVEGAGIIQVGWGGDTWNENEWGDLSGSNPIAAGSQLTSSIGSVTMGADANISLSGMQTTLTNAGAVGGTSVDQTVTGQQLTSSMGEEVIEIIVPVTTAGTLSSSIGTATIDDEWLTGAGWGRRTWGNLAWGDAYSAIATGQQLTSSINFPASGAFTDNLAIVSGSQVNMTFASPSFSIQIDQDIFVLASEDQLDFTIGSSSITGDATVSVTGSQSTFSVGTVVGGTRQDVPVTGSQATTSLGSINLIQSTIEAPTGIQGTLTIGDAEEVPDQIVGVTGSQITGSVGSTTITGHATVEVTGIQFTASTGEVDITAWGEIDIGVTNIWHEVDLAA